MNLFTVNESQVGRLSIKGLISSYLNSHRAYEFTNKPTEVYKPATLFHCMKYSQ